MCKYLEAFKTQMKLEGKSENTINSYASDIKQFVSISKRILAITDPIENYGEFYRKIQFEHVQLWLSEMMNKGNKASTIGRSISACREFFNMLCEPQYAILTENIFKAVRKPKLPKRLPIYMDMGETVNFMDSVTEENSKHYYRDVAIITFMLNLALRKSEVVNINIYDIKKNVLTVTGKGDKQRQIPLNESCITALNDYYKVRPKTNNPALFLINAEKRITARVIDYIVEKYADISGVEKHITPHKLRHTSATLMHKSGTDIQTLRALLGHQNILTTQIYTHVDNETLQKAVNNISINNRKKPV